MKIQWLKKKKKSLGKIKNLEKWGFVQGLQKGDKKVYCVKT